MEMKVFPVKMVVKKNRGENATQMMTC